MEKRASFQTVPEPTSVRPWLGLRGHFLGSAFSTQPLGPFPARDGCQPAHSNMKRDTLSPWAGGLGPLPPGRAAFWLSLS